MNFLVLPAVGPVQPKRRCKLRDDSAEQAAARIVIPIESPRARPARLNRSAQPLQVWKAPKNHLRKSSGNKPATFPLFQEIARLYTRTTALFAAAHFRHSH